MKEGEVMDTKYIWNDYDCSISDRKGCNYCKGKKPIIDLLDSLYIKIHKDNKSMEIGTFEFTEYIGIKVCPMCGKEL